MGRRWQSEQGRELWAQIWMRETKGQEEVEQQDAEQCLDAGVGEAKARDTLALHHGGSLQLSECLFADGAVMADSLDIEETSVGGEADLTQSREILQTAANGEVACVVDRGFGA